MPVVAGAVTVDARDRMSMEVHQNVKGPSPRGRPRAGANGVTASAEPQGATQSHATDGGLMSFLRQRASSGRRFTTGNRFRRSAGKD
jgi:hypothetical protein